MYKNDKFSLLRKLFLRYSLFIIFTYLALVGIIVNTINQNTDRIIESKKMQATHFINSFEQQLDVIYNYEINLTSSGSVPKLAYKVYENEYEKSKIILDLIQNLEGIQALSPVIEDIIITFPKENITLSANNGYNRDDTYHWKNIEQGAEYNYFIELDGNIIMNFTFPLLYSESNDYIPDFNIQVKLSRTIIQNSLNVFNDNDGSGAALNFKLSSDYIIEYNDDIVENFYNRDKVDGNKMYQFIVAESSKYPLSLIAYIDKDSFTTIQNKYIFLLTALMILLTIIYIFSLVYTKRIVISPLRKLMSAFDKIQDGDFNVRIYHEPHDEFNYLYKGFNSAVIYIQELINNIYEQENLIQNAELAQLQSQINPHFLYNSFFIINRMAKNENYELITQFVTSLAKYYRFINKETNDFIPLYKEVEHMNNYIDIQQLRFGEKISINQEELPLDIRDIEVPKLILQPLIENAYNYGMANILEDGLIKISYMVNPDLFTIIIEDNGGEATPELISKMSQNLKDNGDGGNHALFNIHKRLKLAFNGMSGLKVSISELGGIKIEVNIKR